MVFSGEKYSVVIIRMKYSMFSRDASRNVNKNLINYNECLYYHKG